MKKSGVKYAPGGDARAIAEIARRRFGGFAAMFEYHDWPERGSDMMRKVQKRVAETYGSVKAFEEHFVGRSPQGFVDPPSSFAGPEEWEAFLRELKSMLPRYDDVERLIAEAEEHIARLRNAKNLG